MLKIVQVLQDQGRRRTWLAEQIGITPSHMTRILQGVHRWTDERKRRAVAALGWPEERAEELFMEVDEEGELVAGVLDPMAVLRRCRGAGTITLDEFEQLEGLVKLGDGDERVNGVDG